MIHSFSLFLFLFYISFSLAYSTKIFPNRISSSLITTTSINSITSKLLSSSTSINNVDNEKTFIMIKPDGVSRGLVGKIITKFEEKGLKLKDLKLINPSEEILRDHYKDHVEKSFFQSLLSYMTSGPVVAMIWQGTSAVKVGRNLLGATNPVDALPGTIRGKWALKTGENLCHGSDSIENAEREINIWFNNKCK